MKIKPKDAAWVAKRVAKMLIKYRIQPHVALEGMLYATFAVANYLGVGVDDVVELIQEKKEELDNGYAEDDACAGDTQLDACGDESVRGGG